jgi:hypothetical protein
VADALTVTVIREPSHAETTMGSLYLNGVWHCWTLEDAMRPTKIHGQTAIPLGRYRMRMTYSARFQRVLPELFDVPEFSYVRIHAGNTIEDSEGCILVGAARGDRRILRSREALDILVPRLSAAPSLWLEVKTV